MLQMRVPITNHKKSTIASGPSASLLPFPRGDHYPELGACRKIVQIELGYLCASW